MRSVESFADAIEDAISEYNPDWKPDQAFHDFCEYVTQRRMSKEGRFYRVHFKTGATVDLVRLWHGIRGIRKEGGHRG